VEFKFRGGDTTHEIQENWYSTYNKEFTVEYKKIHDATLIQLCNTISCKYHG